MKGRRENGDREVDAIADRILAGAKLSGSSLRAWRKPMREIECLLRRDYVRALRKCLGYREAKSILSAAIGVWPEFNRERVEIPRSRCAEISRKLSVHLSARPYRAPEGLALRGFYVHEARSLLTKPMIYVNTAHHPAAVAATFGHEVGHHLAHGIFEESRNPVDFFFDAAYSGHLDDPIELAADVVVSLGCYPESVARRIFATASWKGGLVASAQHLSQDAVMQVCEHLKCRYHVDFTRTDQPDRNLVYLAGMVHYAKLRWALLAEYEL